MKIYVVELIGDESSYVGEVFLNRSAANTYGERQVRNDDVGHAIGFIVHEREIRGKPL